MKTIRVTRYACEFCGRTKSKRQTCEAHELHCFKNKSRIPYEGEIVAGSSYDDNDEAWDSPGIGKIFFCGKWTDIPNFKYPYGQTINGKTLSQMRPKERLAALWPRQEEGIDGAF